MTALIWRRVAGPISGRSTMTGGAHGMAQHHLPCRKCKLAHRGLPVTFGPGELDLADDRIDRSVEDVVLVPDVAIEGHRLDAELLAELAHAERLDAASVGEFDRGPEHALLGQRGAAFRGGREFGHLTSLQCSAMFTT